MKRIVSLTLCLLLFLGLSRTAAWAAVETPLGTGTIDLSGNKERMEFRDLPENDTLMEGKLLFYALREEASLRSAAGGLGMRTSSTESGEEYELDLDRDGNWDLCFWFLQDHMTPGQNVIGIKKLGSNSVGTMAFSISQAAQETAAGYTRGAAYQSLSIDLRSDMSIDEQPQDQFCFAGGTAVFSVEATGEGLVYLWQLSTDGGATWSAVPGAESTAELTLAVDAASDQNLYRCLVRDRFGGSATSESARLVVIEDKGKLVMDLTGGPITYLYSESDLEKLAELYRVIGAVYDLLSSGRVDFLEEGMGPDHIWIDVDKDGIWDLVMSTQQEPPGNVFERCDSCSAAGEWSYTVPVSSYLSDGIDPAIGSYSKITFKLSEPPEAPILAGSLDKNGRASLVWSAAKDAVKYQLYRSKTGETGSFSRIKNNLTVTTAADTGAERGVLYYYKVRGIGSSGEIGEFSNVIQLMAAPAITTQPASVTVKEDGTASFSVAAEGAESYQWQCRTTSGGSWVNITNSAYTGVKTATMSFKATAARNGYQYRCRVTNAGGSVYSGTAGLTVSLNAPKIETQPASVTVNEGESASFTIRATGGALTYQWQYRSTPTGSWTNSTVTGCKTATISVKATAGRSGYQYRCVVTNSAGSAESKAATLTVILKPTITTQPKSVFAAVGTTASFSVKVSGTGLSYQWQYRTTSSGTWKAATAEGNKTAALKVPATTGRSGYQYRCVVTNSAGSAESNAATLTVLTKPTITTQPKSVTAQLGTTASFSVKASGTGLSYQWQYRTSSSGTWKAATAEGNKTAELKVPATAGRNGYQYRCVVTNGAGSTESNAATLIVVTKPTITTQPKSVTAAVGTTATFTVKASGTGLSYQWQYRTSSSGTWKAATAEGNKTAELKVPATTGRSGYQYRCVVTNSAGSTESNAATLTVVTKPTITTQPKSVTAAVGTTVSFTVKASGTGLSYQWQWRSSSGGTWKDSTLEGNKTATLKVSVTAGRNGYQYRCVVKNLAGSTNSGAATLTVK